MSMRRCLSNTIYDNRVGDLGFPADGGPHRWTSEALLLPQHLEYSIAEALILRYSLFRDRPVTVGIRVEKHGCEYGGRHV